MTAVAKAVEIARINLVRQLRDRRDTFFVFVLPTIIIVALGLQFGGSSRARLGVVVPPADPQAEALVAALAVDPTGFDIRRFGDEADLRAEVERGQLEAGVVIPVGFGAALAGTAPVEVRFVGTTESLTLGLRAPVEAAVARQAAIVTAARVAAILGAGSFDAAATAAEGVLPSVPGVSVQLISVGERGIFAGYGMFTFGAQTQLLLFVFLTSMTAASQLVLTRRLGVSRRMLSTPTGTATIVAGEATGRLAVALLQALYIVVVTSTVFGVSWGDPLAAGLIVLLFSLVAAAVAMLIGSLASSPEQASSLGVFAGLALGALGGCMIPWEYMPPVMQGIARLIPHSWAILGLKELIRNGGGLASVATDVGVLAAYGVAILTIAAWRFRRSITS